MYSDGRLRGPFTGPSQPPRKRTRSPVPTASVCHKCLLCSCLRCFLGPAWRSPPPGAPAGGSLSSPRGFSRRSGAKSAIRAVLSHAFPRSGHVSALHGGVSRLREGEWWALKVPRITPLKAAIPVRGERVYVREPTGTIPRRRAGVSLRLRQIREALVVPLPALSLAVSTLALRLQPTAYRGARGAGLAPVLRRREGLM